MNVAEMHPSKFLTAADLKGQSHKVTIDRLEHCEVGQEKQLKWVLFFVSKDKGLVMNVTNTNFVAVAHGQETDDWHGKEIILYPTKVAFGNKAVDAIRVKVEAETPPIAAADAEEPPF